MQVAMKYLTIYSKPEPTIQGVQEGCGESVNYEGKIYHYNIAGRSIPKGKVCAMKYEGFFCGRRKGDTYYILVCYDNEGRLVLLDNCPLGLKEAKSRFRGLTTEEAIQLSIKNQMHIEKMISERTPCSQCGTGVLLLADHQPCDMCYSCFSKIEDKFGTKFAPNI